MMPVAQFVAGEVIAAGQQPPAVYREVARALARMHACGPVAGTEAGPIVWRFLASLAALYPGGGALQGLLTRDQLLQEVGRTVVLIRPPDLPAEGKP
jgi:hypothetical protein